jgi:hypothetical protein
VRVLVAASIALSLLAGPVGASPTAKDKRACDLLKPSEIEDVVGERIGKGERQALSCVWDYGPEDFGLVLTLFRGREAKAQLAVAKECSLPPCTTEIADLGKEAFSTPFDEVWVVKNKKTVFFISGAPDVAQAQELAVIALERL